MATPKKVETVEHLTDLVNRSKALVFVDYKGLKHKQMEEFRRTLKKVDARFAVTKNRLLLRAMGDNGKNAESQLNSTTATLFAMGDEAAAVKELAKFLKAAAVGKARGGMIGTTPMSEKDVTRLATLPPRDVLLGKVVGSMMSPLYGLHRSLSWNLNTLVWALDAIKAKKSN